MPRRPARSWVTPEHAAAWHARLEKHDPEDTLVHLLWTLLSKDILPSFRFASDPDIDQPLLSIEELVAPLAQDLAAAVLARLADRDKTTARRGPARLLRTRAGWALDGVGYACAWVTDHLSEDLEAHPRDILGARVARLPRPIVLPKKTGGRPAWMGAHVREAVVAVHDRIAESVIELFPARPGAPDWATLKPEARLAILRPEGEPVFGEDALIVAASAATLVQATHVLTAAYVGLSETRLTHLLGQGRPGAAARDRADRIAGRQ